MDEAYLEWGVRAELWSGSLAVAVFASYVALDLSRGVASHNRITVLRSLLGAALALGVGLWATHFISLAGEPLPISLGYNTWIVVAALGLAFACSMVAITLGSWPRFIIHRVIAASAMVGVTSCAVPILALAALHLDLGLQWNWLLLVPGCLAASLLTGAGLWAVLPKRREAMESGFIRQAIVALCLGGSIALGNAVVLKSASVPLLAQSLSSGRLGVPTISALASVGVPVLLCLLLMISVLETHFRKMLRRMREEVKRAAQTDPLTELPNRTMFEESLQLAVIRADRQQHRLALLFINLDGLKTVNESFGQSIGDTLLREMAKRLRALSGVRDVVARAGGDEFLLLLEGNPSSDEAERVANRVLRELNGLCRIEDHEISVSCSIGMALYPQHGELSKLIAHAAAAMRAAKRSGGATHCFFEARMVAGAREQVELLQDLRRAIEHRELELYYQPKIHAPSGQITGAEALMRWKHPQRGMVGPNVFIPLAERFGLINALGNWLIEDVCRQISAWREQGLRMRVAINLSVHQLRQDDLVERIADALQRNRINPSQLTCEITESAAMDDTRVTLQVIERLSALGVHLSIDDFGTGYSSLSYLRQLAAEELKIDRSFVLDLETSADARAIVDAVVKLAQALGLKVVAEGVETEEQQEILRRLGCNELQGYLFAKPMPAKALALWAMNDEGPRALDFRPSLFGDNLTQPSSIPVL